MNVHRTIEEKLGTNIIAYPRTQTEIFVIRLSSTHCHGIYKVRGKKVTWFKDPNYCPHSHSQINEREYALNIVRENDYPKRFLNDSLKPTVCKNHTSNSDGDTSVKSLAASPYIHGVTGQIKRILSNKQFPLYRLIFILAKKYIPGKIILKLVKL